MKRGLIVGLVTALLWLLLPETAPVKVVAAQDFSPSDAVMVNTDALNVRSEPSLDGSVLDILIYGTTASVTDGPVAADGYTWYAINTGEGVSGWVAGEFLARVDSGFGLGLGDGVRVNALALNVRDAPSINAAVFTTVLEGRPFTIASAAHPADGFTWFQVHSFGIALPLAGNVGWVAGEFLVADPGVTGCEGRGPCPTGLEPGDGVRVATDALNLRDAPGLSSTVIAVLPHDAQGIVADIQTYADGYAWLGITAAGYGTGWVAREYIVADPSASGAPVFTLGTQVTVVDGPLNLRSRPTLAADVLVVMTDGSLLTVTDGPVLSNGYTWYEVTSDQYGTGWAAGEFLD